MDVVNKKDIPNSDKWEFYNKHEAGIYDLMKQQTQAVIDFRNESLAEGYQDRMREQIENFIAISDPRRNQ